MATSSNSEATQLHFFDSPRSDPGWPFCDVNARCFHINLRARNAFLFRVTIWEILASKKPFPNKHGKQIVEDAYNGEREMLPLNENWGNFINSLLKDTWNLDPDLRPDISEIVESLNFLHKKKDPEKKFVFSDEEVEDETRILREIETKMSLEQKEFEEQAYLAEQEQHFIDEMDLVE